MRALVAILWILVLSPPPAAPRLLVIGDSLAAGLYASSQDAGYAYLVAKGLGADLGVLRAATVAEARAKLPAWRWAPTLIVVELGLNDSTQGVPADAYLADYHRLLDELEERWPGARIVMTTLWAGAGETERRQEYSAGLRALAEGRGLPLADVAEATRGCGCTAALSQPSPFAPGFRGDGWHPGDEGHRLIAGAVEAALQERVALPLIGEPAYP